MVRPVGLLCYSLQVQDFLSRCRQQLSDVLVELTDCIRVSAEKREVTVDGLDRPELSIGDEPPFRPGNPLAGKTYLTTSA